MNSKYIPVILIAALSNGAAQILLKRGMDQLGGFDLNLPGIAGVLPRLVFNPFIILGLCTFLFSMGAYLLILSRVEISFAYPFLSLAFVLVTIYAYFGFKEDMNVYRIAGITLICFGTILISRGS